MKGAAAPPPDKIHMKIKYLLIPYILIIIILPAMLAHLPVNLMPHADRWQMALDILMALTALGGLALILIRQKGKLRGGWELAALALLVLIPQLCLWLTQHKPARDLRYIYRFGLLVITLFVIPMNLRYSRRRICVLIGCLCLFGFGCCIYEAVHDPKFWSSLFKTSDSIRSFFENSNRFAAYAALWTILCLLAFQLTWHKLWLIPAAFFAFFLFMSKSRGGWALCGVYMLFALISYRRQIGTKNLLMILLDILIVFIFLWMIPPVRRFLLQMIAWDQGVSGRDRIWAVSWGFFREANPFLGHGLGTPIEKIMIERLSKNVSTHSAYLYILNCGGVCLSAFYVISAGLMLRSAGHTVRKHYAVPLLIAILVYGFFELACTPFDFWHLSNMFTVCLFTIPALSGRREK